MAINDKPMFTPGQSLTAEQIAQMMALIPKGWSPGQGAGEWSMDGKFGPTLTFDPTQVQRGTSVGADAEYMNDPTGAGRFLIAQPNNVSTWGGSDSSNVWDGTGQQLGTSTGATDLRGLANLIATSVGSYYLQGMMPGGDGGGAAALTGDAAIDAAIANGALGTTGELGTMASLGSLSPEMLAAANSIAGAGGIGALTGGGAAGSAGAAGSSGAAGSAGATGAGGLSNGQIASTLLGTALGALDGKDKQQTSSRDPWAPAQDFLKQQIATGQTLADQYQKNPFSQAQQTAYGNYGGLLGQINANAGGLLSGFGANASGANNFDRSNPRRQLIGGQAMNLQGWNPGLLGNFGTVK